MRFTVDPSIVAVEAKVLDDLRTRLAGLRPDVPLAELARAAPGGRSAAQAPLVADAWRRRVAETAALAGGVGDALEAAASLYTAAEALARAGSARRSSVRR